MDYLFRYIGIYKKLMSFITLNDIFKILVDKITLFFLLIFIFLGTLKTIWYICFKFHSSYSIGILYIYDELNVKFSRIFQKPK